MIFELCDSQLFYIDYLSQQYCHFITIKLLMLTRTVDYEESQILRIFMITQTIFLLPVIVGDLVIGTTQTSYCLRANFSCGPNQQSCSPFGVLYLGEWIVMDGYIKLAVWAAVLFFNMLHSQLGNSSRCEGRIVALCGSFVRFFYIFDLGWTIYASVLFWGPNSYFPDGTFHYCPQPILGYLFFVLIFSYIVIPISVFISSFRPKKQIEQDFMVNATLY